MEEGGFTFEEALIVAKWIEEYGVDAIEVSGGNTSSRPREGVIRPIRRTKEPQYFAKYAKEMSAVCSLDVGVVGGNRNPQDLEELLQTTNLSFVSLGRPLVKEPDLVKKWHEGHLEAATCISCSRCFSEDGIRCVLNQ